MIETPQQALVKAYTDLGRNLGIFCFSIYNGAIDAGLDKSVAQSLTATALVEMIKALFSASQQTTESKDSAMAILLKNITGGTPQ